MFNGATTVCGFAGLAGFGDASAPDYVRAGDIIRVSLYLAAKGLLPGYGESDFTHFRNAVNGSGGLVFRAMDRNRLNLAGSGQFIIEVQARNDFAKLQDVVGLVAGLAQQSGLYVIANSSVTRGEFVWRAQSGSTSGSGSGNAEPAPTIPPPGTNIPAGSTGSTLLNVVENLTASPLVVIGGMVLLGLVLLKR